MHHPAWALGDDYAAGRLDNVLDTSVTYDNWPTYALVCADLLRNVNFSIVRTFQLKICGFRGTRGVRALKMTSS
jgi:hypothetical protein